MLIAVILMASKTFQETEGLRKVLDNLLYLSPRTHNHCVVAKF